MTKHSLTVAVAAALLALAGAPAQRAGQGRRPPKGACEGRRARPPPRPPARSSTPRRTTT